MKNEEVYHLTSGDEKTVRFHLTGISYPNPDYTIQRTRSGCSVLEYIRRGAGFIAVRGERIRVSAGDSYFLAEGEDHLYFADPKDPFEKIWVNFSGKLAREMASCYGVCSGAYPSLSTEKELSRIVEIARSGGEHADASLALHGCFLRLSASRERASRADRRAAAMRDYLLRHLTTPVSIRELAESVHVSDSTANRLFRAAYGTTPYAFLLAERISLAKELLLSSTLSVKEIGMRLSFADEFYFSTAFKEAVGVSPAKYRQNEQKRM